MYVFISKIDDLFARFGEDKSLTKKENISFLTQKFLIENIKKIDISIDYTISRTEKGKPFFVNEDDLHFSISHTQEYVAVCIDNKEIGIDIETLRTDKLQIAKRFFHPNEKAYLDSLSKEDKDAAFTQLWTIKEAYVKMTGTGIAENFGSIDLSPREYLHTQDYIKQEASIHSEYSEEHRLFISVATKE